jgi:hypothetical protein
MGVVAIDLPVEPEIGDVEPCAVGCTPVPRDPAVVDDNADGRSEETRERPINPVVRDVATAVGVVLAREVRQDRFIRDRGIIEGEGSREIAVARNAMRVGSLR